MNVILDTNIVIDAVTARESFRENAQISMEKPCF
jgi:hypothetical protein